MFSCELLLKLQLLERISYDMEPERMTHLQQIWRLQPEIRPAALENWRAFGVSLQLGDGDRTG